VEAIPIAPSETGLAAVPFSVADLEQLYNFPKYLDGRGETVGIIELAGGYRDSDLNIYFAQSKLPRPAVVSVGVSGAKNSPEAQGFANSQVELDVEVVGSVASKAQIVVYFAPNTNAGYLDAITAAAHDTAHHPSVILIDWGSPESAWTSQAIQAVNQALGAAAQAGITVVAASGDNGASDGVKDGNLHVDFPASSPWVLAVAGTKLIARGNKITSEVVWNDGQIGATGGGVSAVFAQPEWQSEINLLPEAGGRLGRAIPDVSANASPDTGYKVIIDGKPAVIGGTSASAPLWAGLIALLNQGVGRNLGHLNPMLYRQIGDKGVFHAITSGQTAWEA
jgi:kumamolisin